MTNKLLFDGVYRAITCCIGLIVMMASSPAFAQLANFGMGAIDQPGYINSDGTVPIPNIPQIPWSKYTHFAQSYIYPSCATPTAVPAVNSTTLDAVPSSWGKSFSLEFTAGAHAAGKPALVSMVGTSGQDWPNATATPVQTQLFVNSLLAYVNANQYDGIDVDMEAITPGQTQMVAFFQTLNTTFKNASLSWSGRPLIITADTGWSARQLNNLISTYVDKLNELAYFYHLYDYAGSGSHPWHYSAVRRDTTYTGPYYGGNPLTLGYGDGRNYASMDESIWYETYFYNTPYSEFTVGISFAGAAVQGPKLGTAALLGVTALTDNWDQTVANEPVIGPEIALGRLLTPGSLIYSSTWTDPTQNAPGWDDTAKASYIVHNAAQLPTYWSNNGSYGETYMYTADGGATYQPSDAFISYPSIRFIQEAVKWANEQKPAVGQQSLPGYLGGIYIWTVMGDYLPGQTGDAQYPLATAVAEAQDLNAWTYSAPIWDNDTTVWTSDNGTGNNGPGTPQVAITSVYDSIKQHRVTGLIPPATQGPADAEARLLNQPGGSQTIADATRSRYFRFALNVTPPAQDIVFANVQANDGNAYWVEFDCGTGSPSLSPATAGVAFHISNMCDGNWHTVARDLLADLQVMVPGVTSLTQVNYVKIRPWPVDPAVPTFVDDVTLFQYAPPLGEF